MNKNHKSPDGIYRRCSNPANCKYGTSVSEHISDDQAQELNQKTFEENNVNNANLSSGSTKDKDVFAGKLPQGFDPNTAPPKNFDEQIVQSYQRVSDSRSAIDTTLRTVRTDFRYEGMYKDSVEDYQKKFLQAVRQGDVDNATLKEHAQTIENHERNILEEKKFVRAMNKIHIQRGMWNRAYLADTVTGNGHVHKSTHCSTCNKNGKQTKFSWQTDYSGESESKIVADAGYRACTTCYPSAPLGDENSLPTTMFTESERKKKQEQIERESKKQEKQQKAVSNAPTVTGEPLKVGGETFKTERTATTYVNNWYMDNAIHQEQNSRGVSSEYMNKKMSEQREHVFTITKSLAEKHGKSIAQIQEEMKPAIERKIKKHNKDILKPNPIALANGGDSTDPNSQWYAGGAIEYHPETFGLSDKQLNATPDQWDF